MSIVFDRKSTRSFTNQVIEKEQVTKLLQAAMQAPSAHNQQPWEFVVVDDRELLNKLSSASSGAWMLKDVSVAIVPVLIPTEASPHFASQDLAAATQNILLEATSLGLGSVWIGVYPLKERMDHIEKVLNIKNGKHPFSMIALGYPKNDRDVKLRYDSSRVYYNKLGE